MRAEIEVKDRAEARLIRAGLQDTTTRALVKVVGALSRLPTPDAKRRALWYVEDRLARP